LQRQPGDESDDSESAFGDVEYADDGSGLEPHFDNGTLRPDQGENGEENGGAFAHARRFVGRFMHDDRAEPPSGGGGSLSREEVQALQATLSDLLEMKRLLDQAR
jgi:hypothetical protein